MGKSQHHANHGAANQQATAAITDKGKRQALGWQEASINAQINKGLATEQQTEANQYKGGIPILATNRQFAEL